MEINEKKNSQTTVKISPEKQLEVQLFQGELLRAEGKKRTLKAMYEQAVDMFMDDAFRKAWESRTTPPNLSQPQVVPAADTDPRIALFAELVQKKPKKADLLIPAIENHLGKKLKEKTDELKAEAPRQSRQSA